VREALDLARGVDDVVEALLAAFGRGLDAARLGEEGAAAELAQHDHVGAGSQAGAEGRERLEAAEAARRPDADEAVEAKTQAHQAVLHLRAAGQHDAVPRRPADRADQHGVGSLGRRQGFVAAEGAVAVVGGAVQQVFGHLEFEAAGCRHDLEQRQAARHHLRADAIAAQRQDLQSVHAGLRPSAAQEASNGAGLRKSALRA
jgi:hypothetical protein